MPKIHSSVCYICERNGSFKPVKQARPIKNDFGLDLFEYQKALYEGRTGLRINNTVNLRELEDRMTAIGGMEKLQKVIEDNVSQHGISPRYSRPDEKKQDVFPSEKDENLVFATEANGEKHYYLRFYNENGIELFTRSNNKEFFAMVYVPCNGYMIGFDQKHRLDEILKKLPALEGGIYGEVERRFNAAVSDPKQFADLGFARILDRMEEAKKHNAPIIEQRRAQAESNRQERAERDRRQKTDAEQRYTEAIAKAEKALLAGEAVANPQINGKSLVLQLFREHNIDLPLRTQGWVNNSLSSFSYQDGMFQATCQGRLGDPFMNGVIKLHEAVLTKQQFLENTNTDEDENMEESDYESDNGIEP